jgi:hypothetical protein
MAYHMQSAPARGGHKKLCKKYSHITADDDYSEDKDDAYAWLAGAYSCSCNSGEMYQK